MTAYARLPRLTEARAHEVEETLRRLAELMHDTGETATLQCTILVGGERRHWALEVRERECHLKTPVTEPDLEIVTREATWREIAEGRLSPLEAFTQGRLRVLGDVGLGTRLLQQVAADDGAVTLCGE